MAPLASEKTKAKVCEEPLPLLGVTETAAGATAERAVMLNAALALWLNDPLVPVMVRV